MYKMNLYYSEMYDFDYKDGNVFYICERVIYVGFVMQGCMDEFRNDGRITELDRILISALEYDIFQVIEDCR